MFDLNTRIHFYEEKLAIFVQEFEGAGATVIDLAAGLGATLADALDQAAGDARRGSLLDDFLVASLHGAIALAQPDGVATAVGQHLDFDMERIPEAFLPRYYRIIEGRARIISGHGTRLQEGPHGLP